MIIDIDAKGKLSTGDPGAQSSAPCSTDCRNDRVRNGRYIRKDLAPDDDAELSNNAGGTERYAPTFID